MAERARREGLLALEEEAQDVDDPFLSKGLRLVVDGTDPELVKDILDLDVESMAGRHHENADALHARLRLRADDRHHRHRDGPRARAREPRRTRRRSGPAIAAAFIATFLGVASANLFYLPVANKLKELSTHEADARTMMIEGILSIQAGDNPRIVEEKLKTFLEPGRAQARSRRRARPRGGGGARRAGGRSGEEARARARRRALAADLRGHDHAPDGAVHGPVLDRGREQGQVRGARASRCSESFAGAARPTAATSILNVGTPNPTAQANTELSSIAAAGPAPATRSSWRERRSAGARTAAALSAAKGLEAAQDQTCRPAKTAVDARIARARPRPTRSRRRSTCAAS